MRDALYSSHDGPEAKIGIRFIADNFADAPSAQSWTKVQCHFPAAHCTWVPATIGARFNTERRRNRHRNPLLGMALAEARQPEGYRLLKQEKTLLTSGDTNLLLSVDRTRLSYERTLMSWIRTATSLITFGFTIYKFFQFEAERVAITSTRLLGPREFAIMMIAIGLTSLLLATNQHRRELQALKADYPHARVRPSIARLIAGLISILGVTAIVAAVFRQ